MCYADSLTPADTLEITPGTDVQHTSSLATSSKLPSVCFDKLPSSSTCCVCLDETDNLVAFFKFQVMEIS